MSNQNTDPCPPEYRAWRDFLIHIKPSIKEEEHRVTVITSLKTRPVGLNSIVLKFQRETAERRYDRAMKGI